MKKNTLLFTLLALFIGLSSCSQEDDNIVINQPEDAVQLVDENFDLEGSLFTTDIPQIIPVEGGSWNVYFHDHASLVVNTDIRTVMPFDEAGYQIHGGSPGPALFTMYWEPVRPMTIMRNNTGSDRVVYVRWTDSFDYMDCEWYPVETYIQAGS